MCIGNNFAIMEMQIVLAMILQKYEMKLVPGKIVIPDPLITLRPGGGVWVEIN